MKGQDWGRTAHARRARFGSGAGVFSSHPSGASATRPVADFRGELAPPPRLLGPRRFVHFRERLLPSITPPPNLALSELPAPSAHQNAHRLRTGRTPTAFCRHNAPKVRRDCILSCHSTLSRRHRVDRASPPMASPTMNCFQRSRFRRLPRTPLSSPRSREPLPTCANVMPSRSPSSLRSTMDRVFADKDGLQDAGPRLC